MKGVQNHVLILSIYVDTHTCFEKLPVRIVTTSLENSIFFSIFKQGNNLNITNPSGDYDRPKTAAECGHFKYLDIPKTSHARWIGYVKTTPVLTWQKQHSTTKPFAPANWT